MYRPSDIEVTEEYIIFSWLVGRFACKVKGNVEFSICMVDLTGDGIVIDREFNTTPSILPVLKGKEVTAAIVEDERDALAAIAKMAAEEGNKAAEKAAEEAAVAKNLPYIDPDTHEWMVWDVDMNAYVSSGVSAEGPEDLLDVRNAINRIEGKLSLTLVNGTIASANGADTNNPARLRTDFMEAQDIYLTSDDGIKHAVYYYDVDKNYLAYVALTTEPLFVMDTAPNGTAYIRFVIGDNNNSNINGKAAEYEEKIHAYSSTSSVYLSMLTDGLNDDVNRLLESNAEMTLPTFEIGTIASTGVNIGSQVRFRSDFMEAQDIYLTSDEDVKHAVYYYDSDKTYLGYIPINPESLFIMDGAPNGTTYVRFVIGNIDDIVLTSGQAREYAAKIHAYSSTSSIYLSAKLDTLDTNTNDVYESDIPENIGVLNTILNMKQLTDISYTLKANMPHTTGGFTAGSKKKGIPYSSTRPEALFVPNNVSFHTFMTALQNPNSYLYTVDLGDSGNINGDTYYGAVCSTSCGYALGIIPMYSTHQWSSIPGMEIIENQSAYGLKLGDTIVGNGHVVMITDITRNRRGRIGKIVVSEAVNPVVTSSILTPDELESRYPTTKYTYCRYKKIYASKHEQSPYVAVEDEVPQTVIYNTAIIPRKGDKANWLVGTDVVIDVLEAADYTSVEIYKDDVWYTNSDVSSVITLSDLECGSYKARLTGEFGSSDWCSWMVVDAVSNATPVGEGGKVSVTFSASNATPVWVQWANGTNNGTVHITELTEQQASDGVVECSYTAGTYKVRVAFKTEYGIIHSELPTAITVL